MPQRPRPKSGPCPDLRPLPAAPTWMRLSLLCSAVAQMLHAARCTPIAQKFNEQSLGLPELLQRSHGRKYASDTNARSQLRPRAFESLRRAGRTGIPSSRAWSRPDGQLRRVWRWGK